MTICSYNHKGNWLALHREAKDHTPEPAGPHRPAPSGGSSEAGNPTGKATTGNPRASAAEAASQDPDPATTGEDGNSTQPAEASATTAAVRRASRTLSGTEGPPPAHQNTGTPEASATRTAATAEAGPAPAPPGPKAHRTRTADTADNAA